MFLYKCPSERRSYGDGLTGTMADHCRWGRKSLGKKKAKPNIGTSGVSVSTDQASTTRNQGRNTVNCKAKIIFCYLIRCFLFFTAVIRDTNT